MELQEFVKQTLVQVIRGTSDAQKEIQGTGGVINPIGLAYMPKQMKGSRRTDDWNFTQDVKFDVGVTASEGSGTKGGIGVVVGPSPWGRRGVPTRLPRP